MNYYNEIDPFAASWLRELIKAGHISRGEVDERDIRDVVPSDLRDFAQCHFFAGIGVWSYALRAAGWRDDEPVWTGSCPCQPFSAAGKRGGTTDERHLWPAFYHLISVCHPVTVFGEQVASKDGLSWLGTVQADLENADYAFGAVDLCAAGFGAPHIRQRLYFVADATGVRQPRRGQRDKGTTRLQEAVRCESGQQVEKPCVASGLVNSSGEQVGIPRCTWFDGRPTDWIECLDGRQRPVEPGTFPLAHGAPARVGRLRGYGNALVAPVAQAFIEAAMQCLGENT